MKYWFYSEGNILGPYAPSELLSLPAFSEGSLVCAETSTGDNPGDWKAAEGVAEIASAMSVGVGSVISSQAGGISGLYELETGLSSTGGASFYENKDDQLYGYENLLNDIDSILGSDRTSAPAEAKPAPDYEMIDRFDVRLSKIQEELEAARWEKNLLMEKIRGKEEEERKSRERIAELEEKLKGALDRTPRPENEIPQVQRLPEPAPKTDTFKKMEELRKEDLAERSGPVATPAAQPIGESKVLKSIRPSQKITPDRIFTAGAALPQADSFQGENSAEKKEEIDNSALTSRKFKSLGRSQSSLRPLSGEEHKGNAPGGVVFSAQTNAAPKETLRPQLQQPAPVQFAQPNSQQSAPQTEPRNNWQAQPASAQSVQPNPQQAAPQAAQPQNAWQPQPAPVQFTQPYPQQPAPQAAQPQNAWQPQPAPVQFAQPYPQQPAPQAAQPQNAWQPQPAPVQFAQPYPQQPAPQAAQPQNAWQPQPAPVQFTQPYPQQPAPQAAQPQNAWQPQPAPAQFTQPYQQQPAPQAAQPQNTWQPQPTTTQPVQQYAWQPAPQSQSSRPQNSWLDPASPAQAAVAPAPVAKTEPKPAAQAAPAVQNKTERIAVPAQKQKEEVKKNIQPSRKGRGKMAFIATLILFGAVAAGGLGYFFFGEGVSLSELSLLNFSGGGKSKKASFSTQIEPKADKAQPEPEAAEDAQAPVPPDQKNQTEAQPDASGPVKTAGETATVPVKPSVEAAANENTRKAIETVKNYKLSGGRGSVASWFANSFLSNSSTGFNEEWSAPILHGDIFVVQYRLLRPKQDPLIYQFEVDVAKGIIVRGINNSSIELLDFASKTTAKAAPAPKRKVRKTAQKTGKSRGIPILPLPDEPAVKRAQEDPTGFETATPEGNEKVKYIVAQESDEELF